jgi:hypothetical protein
MEKKMLENIKITKDTLNQCNNGLQKFLDYFKKVIHDMSDIVYYDTQTITENNKFIYYKRLKDNLGKDLYERLDKTGFVVVLDDVPSDYSEDRYFLFIYEDGFLKDPSTYKIYFSEDALFIISNFFFLNAKIEIYIRRKAFQVNAATNTFIVDEDGEVEIEINNFDIYKEEFIVVINERIINNYEILNNNKILIKEIEAPKKIRILNKNSWYYFKKDYYEVIKNQIIVPTNNPYDYEIYLNGIFLVPIKDFYMIKDNVLTINKEINGGLILLYYNGPVSYQKQIPVLNKTIELSYFDYIQDINNDNFNKIPYLINDLKYKVESELPICKEKLLIFSEGRKVNLTDLHEPISTDMNYFYFSKSTPYPIQKDIFIKGILIENKNFKIDQYMLDNLKEFSYFSKSHCFEENDFILEDLIFQIYFIYKDIIETAKKHDYNLLPLVDDENLMINYNLPVLINPINMKEGKFYKMIGKNFSKEYKFGYLPPYKGDMPKKERTKTNYPLSKPNVCFEITEEKIKSKIFSKIDDYLVDFYPTDKFIEFTKHDKKYQEFLNSKNYKRFLNSPAFKKFLQENKDVDLNNRALIIKTCEIFSNSLSKDFINYAFKYKLIDKEQKEYLDGLKNTLFNDTDYMNKDFCIVYNILKQIKEKIENNAEIKRYFLTENDIIWFNDNSVL